MRVTILGCAHIHMNDAVEAIRNTAGVEVAAVWDPHAERAAYWAEQVNAPPLSAPSVDDADAVLVMSETGLHVDMAELVASSGKPLFMEKPLGRSHEEAQRIHQVLARAGVLFHSGYFLRENAALQRVRALVRDEAFGKIARVRALFTHTGLTAGWFNNYSWMLDRERSGYGGFGDLGVHLIDLLIWLFDSPVEAVTASVHTLTPGVGIDDTGEAQLRLEEGTIATIGAGIAERGERFELLIAGSHGYATVRAGSLMVETESQCFQQSAEAPSAAKGLQRFLDALTDPSPERLVSLDQAAHHCAVLDACYRAAARQAWVAIAA